MAPIVLEAIKAMLVALAQVVIDHFPGSQNRPDDPPPPNT
jgi:hypothetical protein